MSNPESGSSQYALRRRSPYRVPGMGNAESGSHQSSLRRMSPYRLPEARTCPAYRTPTFCCFDQAVDSGVINQLTRPREAEDFQSAYTYGNSTLVDGFQSMGNPESRSRQTALRRMSPPRLPASTCPLFKTITPLEDWWCQPGNGALICRLDRRLDSEQFRSNYTYGSSTLVNGCNQSMDQKTCIWSCGTKTWLDKSSGIMWVAVHGRDSICVVTRNEVVDKSRVGAFFEFTTEWDVNKLFRETLISEVEDLADPSSESRRKFDQNIGKPFAVVSVIPVTKVHEGSDHEESSPVYDENGAIEFLLEKIKSGSTFTFIETVKTAISAFLHLFPQGLKANDIQVCVFQEDTFPRYLQILDAGEHLSVISWPTGNPGDTFTVERQS